MDFERQLTVIGGLGLVFGLAYLVLPTPLMIFLGIEASSSAAYAARFFGGSVLAWGVLALTAREVVDPGAQSAISGALGLSFLIGAVLAAWGALSGQFNLWGWAIAGLFALLAVLMLGHRFGRTPGRGSAPTP